MSTDAFGNSPAMTEAEMVADGLLDSAGELTAKGAARLGESIRWSIELDICDPDDVDVWASGYSCSAVHVDENTRWPLYRIAGTFERVVHLLRDGYGGLEDEGEAEAYLRQFGKRVDPTPPVLTVEIPGEMLAKYQGGRIIGWVFLPHGSNAGYFGPAARLIDADPPGALESAELAVDDTTGPFWSAVQRSLSESNPFPVEWQE